MTFGYLKPPAAVTHTEPRTRLAAQVAMETLTHLIEGSPEHTPSEADKAGWRARQDELLAMWLTLPDDHEVA